MTTRDTSSSLAPSLTPDLRKRAEGLLSAITPVDTPKWTLIRYDHGGGRLFIDGEAGERTLIADFYNQGDREFYSAAPQLVRELLAALTPPASPPTNKELRDLAWQWVIENKTSDGKGMFDSWFTIHAQEAVRWMATFAQTVLQVAPASPQTETADTP